MKKNNRNGQLRIKFELGEMKLIAIDDRAPKADPTGSQILQMHLKDCENAWGQIRAILADPDLVHRDCQAFQSAETALKFHVNNFFQVKFAVRRAQVQMEQEAKLASKNKFPSGGVKNRKR